jgi:hypothetical protein
MKFWLNVLKGYDYHSFSDFATSLAPSYKYNLMALSIGLSAIASGIQYVFGLNWQAFTAFLVVMVWELLSGIKASRIKGEKFSSMRLSRFGFKTAQYLILVAVPYLLSESFRVQGKTIAAEVLDWLYLFLVVQIVFENVISILENQAVITGKDKTHWISKIQDKLNALFP